MANATTGFLDLTQGVSASLTSFRTSTPYVMKSFGELARASTAGGVLDRKTKELIAFALSDAARSDPCLGFHLQTLVKLVRRARKSTRRWGWSPTWAADPR